MRWRALRIAFWSVAIVATLFICHVSYRLRDASENWVGFVRGQRQPTFSDLVLYSVYLYIPDSFNACINGLRQIDSAIQIWALENNKVDTNHVTWPDILPYFKNGERPYCPYGGAYFISTVSNTPRCTVKGHLLP